MADDDLLVGKVKEVLRKHFNGASDYDLRIEGIRIALPLEIGAKAEYTRQWKAMIDGEIKKIQRLQALTIETAKIINELHSASQIQISKAWSPLDAKATNYQKYLAEITSQIRELTRVFNNAEDMMSKRYPEYGIEKGRERKDEATMCAYMAGITFFYFQGKRPTIIYDAYEDKAKAKGPFLELVSDLFSALNIEASAEACAKKAVKAFMEETHPITGAFLPLSK